MPHVNSCIILWGHVNKPIFKLQKRAVRIMNRSHTDPIAKNTNLLKINDKFCIQLLKLFYKCKQNIVLVSWSTLIPLIFYL